jgi:CheY-like chemotaxis protein
VRHDSVAKCIAYVADEPRVDAFVVDVMMPTCGLFSDFDSRQGRMTGILLAAALRQLYTTTPIIIHTHISWQPEADLVRRAAGDLGDVIFVLKADFASPGQFADLAWDVLADGIDKTRRDRRVKEIGQAFMLQPNIYGVGVDIRKLIRAVQGR